MGYNQERIEITDPETGEVFGVKIGMMVSDVRDMLISKRRNQIMATTWGQLSEDQQRDEIQACTNVAVDLVQALADAIAASGNEVIHAKLDNFKIKDGVVTLTAKGSAEDGALLALNHVGNKNLKIIVADADKFDQQREEVPINKDQPELPMDEDESEGMSDEEIADADQMMSDQDDLLPDDEAEDEPEPESEDETPDESTPELPPRALAQQARLKGEGPDANPFDGGTAEHTDWQAGYQEADAEIKSITDDGYQAASDGKDRSECKWKKGTDAHKFWMEGFDNYTVDVAQESAPEKPAEGEASDGSDSDAYGEGRKAAMDGVPRDQNPKEGAVAARFWNDGWDSVDQQEGVDAD